MSDNKSIDAQSTDKQISGYENSTSNASKSNDEQDNKSIKTSGLESSDLDFIRSTSAAMLEQTPKRSRFLLYLIAIMISVLIYWANHAPLDEISRGDG